MVDRNVDKDGNRAAATAYLDFLYTKAGQRIGAQNFYRPRDPEVAKEFETVFPKVPLFTVEQEFGGWRAAQAKHFAERGVFDDIYSQ